MRRAQCRALHGGAFVFIRRMHGLGGRLAGVFCRHSANSPWRWRSSFKRHRIAGEQHFAGVYGTQWRGGRGFHFAMILPQSRRLSIYSPRTGQDCQAILLEKTLFCAAGIRRSHAQHIGFRSRISEKLGRRPRRLTCRMCGRAAEKVCTGCSQCAVCWRKNRDGRKKTFSRLSYPAAERGKIGCSDFDVPF